MRKLKQHSENRIVLPEDWRRYRGEERRERLDLICTLSLRVWTTTNDTSMYKVQVRKHKDKDSIACFSFPWRVAERTAKEA